jgi:hypothetical protein
MIHLTYGARGGWEMFVAVIDAFILYMCYVVAVGRWTAVQPVFR